MNSTFKKPRLEADDSDLSSIILRASHKLGKFNLFSLTADTYLTMFKEAINAPDKLDCAVDLFFKMLNKDIHPWYFKEIYLKEYSFDTFSKLFLDHADECAYQKVKSLALNLDRFIKFENAKPENELRFYFERKRALLKEIFNLSSHSANLFSASFLDYQVYKRLSKVLSDEDALDSLLEFENKSSSLEILMDLDKHDKESLEKETEDQEESSYLDEVLKEKEMLEKNRDDLQIVNNKFVRTEIKKLNVRLML